MGMRLLLGFSAVVDTINEKIGGICNWLVLLACLVSGGNAMVRYAYDSSSNAWLEVQWYMFAVIVMLGASYTLKRNEHVRVDIVYMMVGHRGQLWIDILGTLIFLLPTCAILAWLSWPFFVDSYHTLEGSSNAGGLIRWPIKLVPPVGFALLALQGLSELIKRVAFLNGIPVPSLEDHYERPTQ
jgi:TRAP-type mannitol/chloroaromatic compound transport system permease small subunit